MKSWSTGNGYSIYRVLAGRSNSYLVRYDNTNLLIDTGKASSYGRLRTNIDSLKIPVTQIDYLVLTHTHFDHCQNAARIKDVEHCTVIIGEKEKEFTEKGYTPVPGGTFLITKIISNTGQLLAKRKLGFRPFVADRMVPDKPAEVIADLNIKLINTPGHSPGSISVIIDNEIAIAGDSIFGIFPGSVFPPFADNPGEMIRSWRILLDSGCKIFLPGHGKEVSRELLYKNYKKYSIKCFLE